MKTAQAEQALCPEAGLSENLDQFRVGQNDQLLITSGYLTPASPDLPDLRLPLLKGQQIATVASVILVATCAATAKVISRSVPAYEGTFQIAVVPSHRSVHPAGVPQIEDTNQNIEIGRLTVNYEALVRALKTPRVINPVVARLQTEGIAVDYTSLANNLHLTHQQHSRTIEVSYRDRDQQTVQRVLSQVAQAYLQEGQACQTSACQGLQFIDAQLPQLQQRVKELQTKLQAFQQQHGVTNPVTQGQQLSFYTVEIAKQKAEIQVKLDQAHDQSKMLQARLGIETDKALAIALLNQDLAYRRQLAQLQSLESQLIQEFSQPQLRSDRIKALVESYQKQLTQLHQQAQAALAHQLANHADLQHALFNQPERLQILQQWIDTVYYIQILQMRQQTIAIIENYLNDRVKHWATLSEQYAEIQQELHVAEFRFNRYLAKRQTLQVKSEIQEITWNLISPPEIIHRFTSRLKGMD